ncbi:MAG: NB-ARC domain-containing protein, partial [Anaerolineae bacterium]
MNDHLLGSGYDAAQATLIEAEASHLVPMLPVFHVTRHAELSDLCDLLVNGRQRITAVRSVRGLSGIGKTTLAVAASREASVLDAYPDGVLWANVGPNPTLHGIQAAWANALDIGAELWQVLDLEARAAALRDRLMLRRCLLVLDDIWDADHLRLLDVGGPGCMTLVTTRLPDVAALAGAERLLGVMYPDQAASLLERWSGDNDAPRPIVAEINWRLGYLPLAIKTIGARIRAGKSWRRMLGSLDRAGIDLSDPSLPIDERDRRLYAAFGLTVEVMPTRRQARLAQLAQLEGPFTLEAAARVWNLTTRDPQQR